jgi:adenylate kinase family enzyme
VNQNKYFNKVLILGCCGAGKSTFASKLHTLVDIPLIHLDQEYWRGSWEPTPDKEWESKVKMLIKRPSWIMDGNYGRTIDIRIKEADTIIFLKYSTLKCMFRVLKRIWQYHGKSRPDMPEQCRERFNLPFLHYVAVFNLVKTPKLIAKLNALPDKNIYIFKNDLDADQFLININRKENNN